MEIVADAANCEVPGQETQTTTQGLLRQAGQPDEPAPGASRRPVRHTLPHTDAELKESALAACEVEPESPGMGTRLTPEIGFRFPIDASAVNSRKLTKFVRYPKEYWRRS